MRKEPSTCASPMSSGASVSSSASTSSSELLQDHQLLLLGSPLHTSTSSSDEDDSDEQIVMGPTGSVRGRRHCVRKSVRAFLQEANGQLSGGRGSRASFDMDDANKCVLYSTSMGIIRQTFDNCRKLRAILSQNWIAFEERDVYLNVQYRHELQERLSAKAKTTSPPGVNERMSQPLVLPCLFSQGRLIGTADRIEALNEAGQLRDLLANYVQQQQALGQPTACPSCGGARFVPCPTCHGSRRSCILHFRSDSIALRCSTCLTSEAGLVTCPLCATPSSGGSDGESNDRHTIRRSRHAHREQRDSD